MLVEREIERPGFVGTQERKDGERTVADGFGEFQTVDSVCDLTFKHSSLLIAWEFATRMTLDFDQR